MAGNPYLNCARPRSAKIPTETFPKYVCVLQGGPIYTITDKNGRVWKFEMHPYLGPCTVDPKTEQPHSTTYATKAFWDAYERWDLAGKQIKMVGKLPVLLVPEWCVTCDGVGERVEKLSRRSFRIVGKCRTCRGRRWMFSTEV